MCIYNKHMRNIKMIKHYTTWMPTNQIVDSFIKLKYNQKKQTLNVCLN